MQFTLTIAVGGGAFGDTTQQELVRLLSRSAGLVESGILSAPLLDGNGNTVGRFALEGD